MCGLYETFYYRNHLLGTERAVGAQSRNPEALQHGHCRLGSTASEHFSRGVKNTGYENREVTVFLCGKYRGLRLIGVIHGLNEHEVRTLSGTDSDNLGKNIHGIVEGEVPHRFKELSCRTDVESDVGIILTTGSAAGFLCETYCGCNYLIQIFGIFQAVGTEGVGVEDMGAGIEIPKMQVDDVFFMTKVPGFGKFSGLKSL